jgi:hypothetical protein
LKQVQLYDGKNQRKLEFAIRKFSDEFASTLLSFMPQKNNNFDKNLIKQIDGVKPLRNLFYDYVEALIMCDIDAGSAIGDFFEQVYNDTYKIEKNTSYFEDEFEFTKFVIWEMFIGTTAILLHYEKYKELNSLLDRTYFIRQYPTSDSLEAVTFRRFRPHLQYIENHIKPKSETPNKFTLSGDIVVKHEKLPIISKLTLANADLVLYQMSCVLKSSSEDYHKFWFPMLYIYAGSGYSINQAIWSKMISIKHCQNLFPLLGVTNLEQLKERIQKSQPEQPIQYSGSFDPAATILQSIQLEKIGTMP